MLINAGLKPLHHEEVELARAVQHKSVALCIDHANILASIQGIVIDESEGKNNL